MRRIIRFLERERDAVEIESLGAFRGLCDMLLKLGVPYTPRSLPDSILPMYGADCYAVSMRVAIETGLTYVEGYALDAVSGTPVRHAWCIDQFGGVVDATWATPGAAYFGIPIRTAYLVALSEEMGTELRTVLDCYQLGYPLFTGRHQL